MTKKFAILARGALAATLALAPAGQLSGQDASGVRVDRDSLTIHFVQTDLRSVIQSLGRYLAKPVLVGAIPATPVTFETPGPVPRASVATYLRGIVEAQNLELTEDSAFFRVAPRAAPGVATGPSSASAGAASQTGAPELFVIRLKHAHAADVAATLNLLFGGGGEFSGHAGLSTGTLSDELRRNVVPPAGPPPAASSAPPAGHPASLSGPVTIVPDEMTNSLLIRASAADEDVLSQAVDQLDIRPLQVLIEVLIVEARHDRSFSLGGSFTVGPAGIGHGAGTISGSSTGASLGDLVVQIMHLGHADVSATLSAAASKGDVEIVSRPVLLASNNTEAHFLVGSQQPFVQVSRSLPTDTPTRDQVVEYRDVGTKLTVKPTINQDGYVSLLIQQEVNQATGETQFDAPVISTREAETQVLVKDGQTIVIGGLRDQQIDHNQSGIPILSGIPIIGGLFGSGSRTKNQTELYLFLTPRILRTDADVDSVTAPRLPKTSN